MKRLILYICLLLGITYVVEAQQLPQLTNYMLNDYILNPALSGIKENFEIKSDYRQQWVGIVDAPVTYILSADGPVASKNMGYGGYVYNDVTGPTRRLGVTGTYAYHAKLTEKWKLSLGLSAGLLQYTLDGSQISLHDPGDMALSPFIQNTLVPAFGFGALLYSDKFYLGASVPQIYQDHLQFTGTITALSSVLATHYYISAGYKYDINDNYRLEPSLLFTYVNPVPPQLDLGLRLTYKGGFWGGIGLRTGDAIPIMVGYTMSDYISFGYSYDILISSLRKYSTGSHEIMLAIKFKNKSKK